MGAAVGALFPKIDFGSKVDNKDLDDADNRRRNSLVFYVSQFIEYEEEEYGPLVESVKTDKNAKTGGKPPNIRNSKFSKIADSILRGNMKELRNQVIVHFKSINREYKDHHQGNTLLHMICQEGYFPMLHFLTDPKNKNDLDADIELNIEPRNYADRTPLFLCFTPPIATYNGMMFGVGSDGNPNAEMPEEIEYVKDWLRPGGPKSKENCIKTLVGLGANVNDKDFHDFTALHYASIWGWTSTVRFLLNEGAEINAMTVNGRTALMYAVQYQHEHLVTLLAHQKNIEIDAADAEGYTALILAIDMGQDGLEMSKTLLNRGADINAQTVRRKTPLKIACAAQDVDVVNMLLDHKVQRRQSAFNLLKDTALATVQRRLDEDDKKEAEEAARLEKEHEIEQLLGYSNNSSEPGNAKKKHAKTAYGAWVEYLDKRSGKPFYYNPVTRKSVREKPKDFKPNKSRIVKEAIFGLSFYH